MISPRCPPPSALTPPLLTYFCSASLPLLPLSPSYFLALPCIYRPTRAYGFFFVSNVFLHFHHHHSIFGFSIFFLSISIILTFLRNGSPPSYLSNHTTSTLERRVRIQFYKNKREQLSTEQGREARLEKSYSSLYILGRYTKILRLSAQQHHNRGSKAVRLALA